jgi:hypothetical protein
MLVFWLGCGGTSVIEVAPEISLNPAVADFGVVAVGDAPAYTLALAHDAGATPVIGDITFEGPFALVEAPEPLEPYGSVEVLVQYTPSEPGYQVGAITVAYDNPDAPTVTSVLRGRAVVGDAVAWPKMLDFGPVPADTQAAVTLYVDNTGLAPLRAESASFSDPAFLVTRIPSTIAAGERFELPVYVRPRDDQPLEATLTLTIPGVELPIIRLRVNNCGGGDPHDWDQDLDGYAVCGGDCDDTDPSVHPGVPEIADGVDQDCDGVPDDGTDWGDDDGDGFAEADGDCNDDDAAMSPGRTEIFGNGLDDDCDGTSDTGAGDADGDGFSATDCDDADPLIHPGRPETVDGIDEDCDGIADDGTTAYDDDADGETEDEGDCNDADATVWTGAAEEADFVDDDCDGTIDEGTVNVDDDGDGASEVGGDCDDADPEVGPGILEAPGNGVDDDCDGTVD